MEKHHYTVFLPPDKSWTIRMGVLDLLNKKPDTLRLLEKAPNLPTDLTALVRASKDWVEPRRPIHVGESGTLYRFLLFASWKLGTERTFVVERSLRHRKITLDPAIVTWSIKDLLKLDNETSQWASAAVLWEKDPDPVADPPPKLTLTYEAVRHWRARREKGECWDIRLDATIQKQMEALLKGLEERRMSFTPHHSEDYCFARAFNLVSPGEGIMLWPSLQSHESNRIMEMESGLTQYMHRGETITSQDHRVIQAITLKALMEGKKDVLGRIRHKNCVLKSWPLFWEFLREVS